MFGTTQNYTPPNRQLQAKLRFANATAYSGLKNVPSVPASSIPAVSNANRKAFIKARLQREYNDLKSRIGYLRPEEVMRMRNLNKGMKNLNGGSRKSRKARKSRKSRKGTRRA